MSQFVTKNPPWVRAGLVQHQPPQATASILTAGAANPLATAAAVVAAAQNQSQSVAPAASASYGTGLAAITLTQSALQQGAMLQQNGMVVELARLPQPGVQLPTSLSTTQVGSVSYPAPRLLGQQLNIPPPVAHPQVSQKHRVFTGTVTKLHENFGFVDDEVFFQMSAVKGTLPKAGERVLVEATYNENMPFKWNASRIQVLPNQVVQVNVPPANAASAQLAAVVAAPASIGINVTPAMNAAIATINSQNEARRWQELAVMESLGQQRLNLQQQQLTTHANQQRINLQQQQLSLQQQQLNTNQRLNLQQQQQQMNTQRQWIQQDLDFDKSDNKGSRMAPSSLNRRHQSPPLPARRERDLRADSRQNVAARRRDRERYSPPPARKRSRSPRRVVPSPPRRRQRVLPRYTVQVPNISLDLRMGNVMELRRRYNNLYIPSDFCAANFVWQEAFPPHRPFLMDHPSGFHIISKDLDPIVDYGIEVEPNDVDYCYSAKVMLMSTPALEEIFSRSCSLAQDKVDGSQNFVHPTRLISFLVGLKGKNETVAIGGPYSPSLDGSDLKDPGTLVKTAIRTCKWLTGIDLSNCSQWYRFAEIHYRRGESHKRRMETVVLFIPDVWNCLPTLPEWERVLDPQRQTMVVDDVEDLEANLIEVVDGEEADSDTSNTNAKKDEKNEDKASEKDGEQKEIEEQKEIVKSVEIPESIPEKMEVDEQDVEMISEDKEAEEGDHKTTPLSLSTNLKTLKVDILRQELSSRNLNSKGNKSQLILRLRKELKAETLKATEGKTEEEDDNTIPDALDSAEKVTTGDSENKDENTDVEDMDAEVKEDAEALSEEHEKDTEDVIDEHLKEAEEGDVEKSVDRHMDTDIVEVEKEVDDKKNMETDKENVKEADSKKEKEVDIKSENIDTDIKTDDVQNEVAKNETESKKDLLKKKDSSSKDNERKSSEKRDDGKKRSVERRRQSGRRDEDKKRSDSRRRSKDGEKKCKHTREKTVGEKYNLPESPVILVQPSKKAKSGKFDCTMMSLSLLLDYRQEDNKEHSFEVSLFAELFNEMMMRDFGFRIYRALVEAPEATEEQKAKKSEDKKDRKEDDKRSRRDDDRKDRRDESRDKKDDKEDKEDSDKDDFDSEEDDEDDKKDKDRKRSSKPKKSKLVTHDPFLLLSFVYFDQTHCGYIMGKDLEDIFNTLGLMLSRAQIKKLIQKVCKTEMLRYRRMTDHVVNESKPSRQELKMTLEQLALGNKRYMRSLISSQQNSSSDSKNSLVSYKGAFVDVQKLMKQLARSERARVESDDKLKAIQQQVENLKETIVTKDKNSQTLTTDLEEQKKKLQTTEDELQQTKARSDLYRSSLESMKETLHMVLLTTEITLADEKKTGASEKKVKEEKSVANLNSEKADSNRVGGSDNSVKDKENRTDKINAEESGKTTNESNATPLTDSVDQKMKDVEQK